jgi:hypothetical protein
MQDEFGPDVETNVLLDALTSTRVALAADGKNIKSHAAQTAFITTAILMVRSGHQVFLIAPDVEMVGPQPPLQPGGIIEQLIKVGNDLLPGITFAAGDPEGDVDLVVAFGDTNSNVRSQRHISVNGEAWAGLIAPENRGRPWQESKWPFGALAAAGLSAGEAFKIAMHKLLPHARSRDNTAAVFAATNDLRFELAPPDTGFGQNFGEIDCVSGGAVTSAFLYCLARIPAVNAHGRIIEPDTAELTNLNRYMLLLRSNHTVLKAPNLSQTLAGIIRFAPIIRRYDLSLLKEIGALARNVVVGVDHIPTRWAVQEAMPEWLVIGATTHWSAMASFHCKGMPCARCLHYRDDQGAQDDAPIATSACVSFWAGLLSASYLARHVTGQTVPAKEQQMYLTPFRPEKLYQSAVAVRQGCSICSLDQH